MLRLVRITESVEKDDKVDKLIDAVLRIYKNDLNDDEVVRLVSNLRKQANDIISQRKKVDVMINNDEEKVVHDWEDQVTTDKSPVTDDAEIEAADKVSHPDSSSDDIENDDESDTESRNDKETIDNPKDKESATTDNKSEDEVDKKDSEDKESSNEDVTEDDKDDKSKSDEDKSSKSSKSTKNEGFILIRLS